MEFNKEKFQETFSPSTPVPITAVRMLSVPVHEKRENSSSTPV